MHMPVAAACEEVQDKIWGKCMGLLMLVHALPDGPMYEHATLSYLGLSAWRWVLIQPVDIHTITHYSVCAFLLEWRKLRKARVPA
jgi:hypothetical protein